MDTTGPCTNARLLRYALACAPLITGNRERAAVVQIHGGARFAEQSRIQRVLENERLVPMDSQRETIKCSDVLSWCNDEKPRNCTSKTAHLERLCALDFLWFYKMELWEYFVCFTLKWMMVDQFDKRLISDRSTGSNEAYCATHEAGARLIPDTFQEMELQIQVAITIPYHQNRDCLQEKVFYLWYWGQNNLLRRLFGY